MYVALMMLAKQKFIQLSHYYLNLVLSWLKLLLKSKKCINCQILITKLVQAGGNSLCSEIHKFFNSIWNKEELPHQWKESIIVPIYKKGGEMDCSNCRRISLLPTTYKNFIQYLP